ncbi:hypothetical protein AA0116_g126 [Alternaria tenuissima]|nr:hypothetical protein AA0116_g126 [Alternaria tenuissima]
MRYADGDYDKRKNAAMKRLRKAIEEDDIEPGQSRDVLRIGGASWFDLVALKEDQLRQLDLDLQEYQKWLLVDFPKQHKNDTASIANLSQDAGKRMKDLLAKQRVHYQDLSDLGVRSWEKPWAVYKDERADAQARLQALVQNRWFWTKRNENVFTIITAARTFEDLMIWRGTW